jgi:hypothetical protein
LNKNNKNRKRESFQKWGIKVQETTKQNWDKKERDSQGKNTSFIPVWPIAIGIR